VRLTRIPAAMVGAALAATLAASVFVGSAAASAASRFRSGSQPAHLVSHVTPGGNEASVLTGSNVMAGIVGSLAVVALAYLIVTYIRRRTALT